MTQPKKSIKIDNVISQKQKNFLIWFQSKIKQFSDTLGDTYMNITPSENYKKTNQNMRPNKYTTKKEYNDKQNLRPNENDLNNNMGIKPIVAKEDSTPYKNTYLKNSLDLNSSSVLPSLDSELMSLKFPNVLGDYAPNTSNFASSPLNTTLDSTERQTLDETNSQKFSRITTITQNVKGNQIRDLKTNEEQQKRPSLNSLGASNMIIDPKSQQLSSTMLSAENSLREEISLNTKPMPNATDNKNKQNNFNTKKSFVSDYKKLMPSLGSFSDKTQNENNNSTHNKKNSIESRAISQNSRFMDVLASPKQPSVSITYEEIGLFPRSFNRVFDRFFKQLFFDVENLVIQEYRFYRYLFLTTVKCVFILIFVPFLVNFICKNYLVKPITEYYWNSAQPEIFLNSYQQKRAFTELKDFEEKIYFESLIDKVHNATSPYFSSNSSKNHIKKQTFVSYEKESNENITRLIHFRFYNNARADNTLDTSYIQPYRHSTSYEFPTETTTTQNVYTTNKIVPKTLEASHKNQNNSILPIVEENKELLYEHSHERGLLNQKTNNYAPYQNKAEPKKQIYVRNMENNSDFGDSSSFFSVSTKWPKLFVNETTTTKPNVSELFNSDKISSFNFISRALDNSETSLFNENKYQNNSRPYKTSQISSKKSTFYPINYQLTMPNMIEQNIYEINENNFMDASSFNDKNYKLDESIQKRLQQKTLELAIHYNEESIESITNFFADLISFSTLCFLLFNLEIQINITKSFLLEVFFGLDDSKKSLLILFVTDLLVGYHSPNIWELFFQSLFDHYGLPESQTTIFLLVATLPVLLDVLFKYLIFRHLNRASPATVATYHAMIE